MKTSLFADDMPESLSPKVAWLRANNLTTCLDRGWTLTIQKKEHPEEGNELHPWSCYSLAFNPENPTEPGFGATEDDAIISFCGKHGLKHYSLP